MFLGVEVGQLQMKMWERVLIVSQAPGPILIY